jgi:hypothetical protein
MSDEEPKQFRFGRLEWLLVAAVVALVLQVFPSLWFGLLWLADMRHWPRAAWLGLNAAIILGLFALRFGPGLIDDWRRRRERLAAQREKQAAQRAAKEQRETLEQIKQGRRRRMY